jgi:acyl-CoA reductase-like NAD-dependent aldehyde dehydrogenase
MNILNNFKEISSSIYSNGKFIESKSTDSIEVVDPATEDRLGQIPRNDPSRNGRRYCLC